MSMLDTVYEMNRERIQKGKRVITYAQRTGTVYYPLGTKERKEDEDNISRKNLRRDHKRTQASRRSLW